MHLLADLRRAFIALERVEKNHEWDTLETEIREEFDRLEKANNDLGNKHDEAIESLRKQADEAITRKDVQYGRIVLKRIHEQFFAVTYIYQIIGFIHHHSQSFGTLKWKDPMQARSLLNKGLQIIQNNPTAEELLPIVRAVIDLLDIPENEKANHRFIIICLHLARNNA